MPNPKAQLWREIQDIIGSASLWPRHIRRLFWSGHIDSFNRTSVATFVFVNGLNPEVFLEWASLLKLCRDRAARNHFKYLFRTFEADPRRYPNLYAYNISNNRYE